MTKSTMIETERCGEFLCSQFAKDDSLEQLTNIQRKVDYGIDRGRFYTNWAQQHESGFYPHESEYEANKQAYHKYREAMRNLGDAYNIANYFTTHFLCPGHDHIPHCFMNYLFKSIDTTIKNYPKIKKEAKRVLHKAAKLRLRGKFK